MHTPFVKTDHDNTPVSRLKYKANAFLIHFTIFKNFSLFQNLKGEIACFFLAAMNMIYPEQNLQIQFITSFNHGL